MDLRGELSTRYAWGYVSPDESILVNDDGEVYVRVEASTFEQDHVQKVSVLRIAGPLRAALKRVLRWSRIVKDLYTTEDEPVPVEDPPRIRRGAPPRLKLKR